MLCVKKSFLFILQSVHLELRGNYNLSMKFQKVVEILNVAVAVQFVAFATVVILAGLAVFGVIRISFCATQDC